MQSGWDIVTEMDDLGKRTYYTGSSAVTGNSSSNSTGSSGSSNSSTSSGSSCSTVKYFHYNHRGDTVLVTDSEGNLLNNFTYEAYGKATNSEGININNLSLKDIPNLFVGASGIRYDTKTDLHYMRFRWFSPKQMRFISSDLLMALNRYAYVEGNPITRIDPSGLDWWGPPPGGLPTPAPGGAIDKFVNEFGESIKGPVNPAYSYNGEGFSMKVNPVQSDFKNVANSPYYGKSFSLYEGDIIDDAYVLTINTKGIIRPPKTSANKSYFSYGLSLVYYTNTDVCKGDWLDRIKLYRFKHDYKNIEPGTEEKKGEPQVGTDIGIGFSFGVADYFSKNKKPKGNPDYDGPFYTFGIGAPFLPISYSQSTSEVWTQHDIGIGPGIGFSFITNNFEEVDIEPAKKILRYIFPKTLPPPLCPREYYEERNNYYPRHL